MAHPTGAVEIPLTRGMVALVDAEHAEFINQWPWWPFQRDGGCWYARTHHAAMHTVLTGWELVDHINGDGLDNRLANLRPADPAQNAWNSRKRKPGASRFKGISRHGPSWRVEINVRGRRLRVGGFHDEEAAARAYDDLAREHFGEFAALNFPGAGEQSALL